MRMMEMYFDDLSVGQSEVSHRRTITEADVTQWCMFTGDWFPIHVDKVYAAESIFKERIAPGVMIMAIAGGLVVPPQTQTVIANYGTERVRYPNPTLFGDTVHVVSTVVEMKERDDKSGLVDLRWDVTNQNDKIVCSIIIRILFKRRAYDEQAG